MGFGRWYHAQKAGVQAAVVSGIVTIAAGVVAGGFGIVNIELAKPGAQASSPGPAPTLTTPAARPASSSPDLPAPAGTPTTARALSGTGPASGTFTYPAADAESLPGPGELTARGTVEYLEVGHHLLVFLHDQQTYWAGDPDVAVSPGGHWSGTVCIGFQGDITLYLVDIGPAGLARLKADQGALWGAGGMPFPPASLAHDVSVLQSIVAHANGKPSHCTAEPALY